MEDWVIAGRKSSIGGGCRFGLVGVVVGCWVCCLSVTGEVCDGLSENDGDGFEVLFLCSFILESIIGMLPEFCRREDRYVLPFVRPFGLFLVDERDFNRNLLR